MYLGNKTLHVEAFHRTTLYSAFMPSSSSVFEINLFQTATVLLSLSVLVLKRLYSSVTAAFSLSSPAQTLF